MYLESSALTKLTLTILESETSLEKMKIIKLLGYLIISKFDA